MRGKVENGFSKSAFMEACLRFTCVPSVEKLARFLGV